MSYLVGIFKTPPFEDEILLIASKTTNHPAPKQWVLEGRTYKLVAEETTPVDLMERIYNLMAAVGSFFESLSKGDFNFYRAKFLFEVFWSGSMQRATFDFVNPKKSLKITVF